MSEKARKARKSKKKSLPIGLLVLLFMFIVVVAIGAVVLYQRYSPSKEHMGLDEYFILSDESQVAVIFNGSYIEEDSSSNPLVLYKNNELYIEISWVKSNLDDGYVYDSTENTLRYATADEVITATLNSSSYYIDKQIYTASSDLVIYQSNDYYISVELLEKYSDFFYSFVEDPNRVMIETVGYTSQKAQLTKNVGLRRLAGIKSKILKDGTKGEEVTILEDYGKWSRVLTEDGVLCCVQNKYLEKTEETTREATMAERVYNHISFDGTIMLGWHQVTNTAANSDVASVLADSSINVISPTWFYLNDNYGGIADLASLSYVSECHSQGVQVWALVSNLEDSTVDTTSVLNTTSSRDALVNNLISAAITYNLDGINIDMESLSSGAADGYIQFIRELSIKCEKNDIILSVDNYVPTEASAFYNRSVQADYADYVIIMGYDEHNSLSDEPGSVASITFVEEGVINTLAEVPAEQVILGMPFYTRVWTITSDGFSCSSYGMDATVSFYSGYYAEPVWSEDSGQYYVQIDLEDVTYKVWLEEETSLSRKLEVMQNYNLAGAAFWKLGLESSSVWNTIELYAK